MTKTHISYLGDLRTECTHESGAKIQTDAPQDNMGRGKAFCPTDLFATSLGACMMTVMAIEAKKLGVDLKGAEVDVEKQMHIAGKRRVGKLIVRFRSSTLPNGIAREKLERVAVECPVYLSIHPDVKVEVDFVWGL